MLEITIDEINDRAKIKCTIDRLNDAMELIARER